jgi:hypothetical protein
LICTSSYSLPNSWGCCPISRHPRSQCCRTTSTLPKWLCWKVRTSRSCPIGNFLGCPNSTTSSRFERRGWSCPT